MRVFVTGATGFIGSAVVQELIQAGHSVLGLARNDASEATLEALGVQSHRGDLSDVESLVAGARVCDGVIHTAFIHDFTDIVASGKTDLRAVDAMGNALAGTGKPFVVTSGVANVSPGRMSTENDVASPNAPASHRVPSDEATQALAARGVRASLLRLPPSVHGDGDHGFVPALIAIARDKGTSAYIGDGGNRWPAVHRLDAATLYRLALEQGIAGARYHGVADAGVPTREIAEVIGRRLHLPVVSIPPGEASAHFGWLGGFFGLDCPSSSTMTRRDLGWAPSHPDLISDLDRPQYFGA